MDKKLTREDITKLNPCAVATDEFVLKYFNGQEYITFSDILLMDMKNEYKLWLVLSAEFIPSEKIDQLRGRFILMMGNSRLVDFVKTCSLVDSMEKLCGQLIKTQNLRTNKCWGP
jgi:hypothetical protein